MGTDEGGDGRVEAVWCDDAAGTRQDASARRPSTAIQGLCDVGAARRDCVERRGSTRCRWRGMVYVGLPVWTTGYAPKNSVRGTSDKLRVLVVNAEADGRVERTMDFPTQSLNRLDLRLAADGKLLVLAGAT